MRHLVTATLALCLAAIAGAERPGVIVAEVEPGGALERAGIRRGDVLLSWERAPSPPANPDGAGGLLLGPYDLAEVENEQLHRGAITVHGTRDGRPLSIAVPPEAWPIPVQPRVSAAWSRRFALAQARLQAGEAVPAADGLLELAAEAGARGDTATSAWLFVRLAGALHRSDRWEEAQRAWAAAIDAARAAADEIVAPRLHIVLADRLTRRGEFGEATRRLAKGLAGRRAVSCESLAVTMGLNRLGIVAHMLGDMGAAERRFHRGLAITRKVAPQSSSEVHSLNNLGILLWSRGSFPAAEALYRRALVLQERLAPDGLEVAAILNGLGVVSRQRGDLAEAEALYRRGLSIKQRLMPDSPSVSTSLRNLGVVALDRGDLAAAHDYHVRALEIEERHAPSSLDVAAVVDNLGVIALRRGDLDGAAAHFRRALEIAEQIAPTSLDVASTLANLGDVATRAGDLAEAERLHRRALEITERAAPDSLTMATTVVNLGEVALARGDLDTARTRFQKALAIHDRVAPAGFDAAQSLCNLGKLADRSNAPDRAEAYYHRALRIVSNLAPGSSLEAHTLHQLGVIARRTGRTDEALSLFARAVEAVETQLERLGGSVQQRGSFQAEHMSCYQDYLDLLLELGRSSEAFHTLERSRARGLLAMLAERDLVWSADIPAQLDRERRLANADYARALGDVAEGAGTDEAQQALRRRLDEIRQRQERIKTRIRAASPRLASLTYPEPLTLDAMRRSLEPGTLLLAWTIGAERSWLFAIGGADEPAVHLIEIGEEELRASIERLFAVVRRTRAEAGTEALVVLAARLTETLLAPASEPIARAQRLVLVPDAALHLAPFAMLRVPGALQAVDPGWLVQARPTVVVSSATLLTELRGRPEARAALRIAAFGDPAYPSVDAATFSSGLDHAVKRGLSLAPLPATRAEVTDIGELFPGDTRLWLGREATEERAKAVGREVTVLHLATHGLLDGRSPLESCLALAIPAQHREDQENGLLQAWEIFEQVRIDADLVVLSACDTALGEEVAGEGIIGLTRAFQYAGARSVLASLWMVADDSTAELMKRFYTNLRDDDSKDVALQKAQIDFIAGPIEIELDGLPVAHDYSHPFHWAGFQLIGDWR